MPKNAMRSDLPEEKKDSDKKCRKTTCFGDFAAPYYHSLKLIFKSTSPPMPSILPVSEYCHTAYS